MPILMTTTTTTIFTVAIRASKTRRSIPRWSTNIGDTRHPMRQTARRALEVRVLGVKVPLKRCRSVLGGVRWTT